MIHYLEGAWPWVVIISMTSSLRKSRKGSFLPVIRIRRRQALTALTLKNAKIIIFCVFLGKETVVLLPDAPGVDGEPPLLDPVHHSVAGHKVVQKIHATHVAVVLDHHVRDGHLYKKKNIK